MELRRVAKADMVDADNTALHVVETACVSVGEPTIISVEGHPAVDVINVGWALWWNSAAKVRRALQSV